MINGGVFINGSMSHCINEYLALNQNLNLDNIDFENFKRSGNGKITFSDFYVENGINENAKSIFTGDYIKLVFVLKVNDPSVKKINIGFSLHNDLDDIQTYLYSEFQNTYYQPDEEETIIVKFELDEFPFTSTRLFVHGRIVCDGVESDWPKQCVGRINIENGDFYKTGKDSENIAPFLIKGRWK